MESASSGCQTPVLFLVHRRPRLTAQVFAAIRQARPSHLLVAADGPEDDALCRETRRLVQVGVDWPCNVQTRFSVTQLGCKKAVSQALDWAFCAHKRLIVLEDDCLPEASFFPFCDEMLARYAKDTRVMQVCGSNLAGWQPEAHSYFFSRFGSIWGWASWRRAWQCFDLNMATWPQTRQSGLLQKLCPQPLEGAWRMELFDAAHAGQIDTWDTQWAYARIMHSGIHIIPERHLVANIGFGPDATHNADDPLGKLPTVAMPFPLRHPNVVRVDEAADRAYLENVAGLPKSAWSPAGVRYAVKRFARQLRNRLRSAS
ncbi:MAG: hypothetical protein R3F13_02660 [Prosthecobacter sp.]